jgi:23S rRNA pseudouridine2605 synthase
MSKNAQFQKFINKKSNAAIKEGFKQEKKAAKKERSAAIEKRYEEKRRMRSEGPVFNNKPAISNKPTAGKTQKAAIVKPGIAGVRPSPVIQAAPAELMPLNKYVAHSGVCSRRDAAELIKQGEVTVNGNMITEPGTKVSPRDIITVRGKKITPSKNLVYILLNKPKDYITTLEDPEGRKTVLDLIKRATTERIYPVGRLDRNTSGVLILTNDGDLAQTLSHPKHLIKKIYEVRLDKPVTKADFDKLLQGITLEDGFIAPDSLGYVDPRDKSIIGIEIHSGRNRIVRRIFESLGYDVRQLDRVMYAGLTKKNVQRGKWRFLTEKEVRILKHFNPQTKKEKAGPATNFKKKTPKP